MAVIDNDRRTLARNAYYDGPYSTPLPARTLNVGTPDSPVRRRVRLHDQNTGLVVREVWSDPITGSWQFTSLAAGRYYVIAFDHTGQYNGEVVTGIILPTPPAP